MFQVHSLHTTETAATIRRLINYLNVQWWLKEPKLVTTWE